MHADETRAGWSHLIQEFEAGKFPGMDENARKRFYLKVIERIHEENNNIKEVIELKNLVNNNEGKIKVVNSLFSCATRPSSPQQSPPPQSVASSLHILSLEDNIKEAEEESQNLESEINSVKKKYSTIEREVKRAKEGHDGRDIDAEISELRKRIRELEDHL